ncbi:ABC transporter ATP-binding protein [Bradyrhizobium sp. CCBAU 11361]|uniref:ABC transporter ATP-binding protein n=1 Tax=Bradyrhizobium sp. CCBAU 11361 TaxID=1630812 RepID=UPI0023045E04|nr:ABC transporter ATP-binding protein [Bradyrhizobium sp. CCBAU 11361]MDA9490184.1 ABC transporter ATP-binding protein [Bradyrhizobium sp. CCBAU 11361]
MTAPQVELLNMTKRFGANLALNNVSLLIRSGTVHALLGENGAGKSTLVKCLVGFYHPDDGHIQVNGREHRLNSPKDADALGIGMVYQHFTLVPSMTVAQNLVISGARLPAYVNWQSELKRLADVTKKLPFHVPLDVRVSQLSAGEKQKAEIVKQLYLGRKLLILDEPTSVLTPAEADEVLGYVRSLTRAGELSAVLISHKFHEVRRYADDVTVLRRGASVRTGAVADLSDDALAEAMIGEPVSKMVQHAPKSPPKPNIVLSIKDLCVNGDNGLPAVKDLSLAVREGEIVGIAGVSGNGQLELVETLMGQRDRSGAIAVSGAAFNGRRREIARLGVYGLPQEPLKNACIDRMSLAENLALRNFDRAPLCRGIAMNYGALTEQAEKLVKQFRVKAPGLTASMSALSGGNVQRAVLARELTQNVRLLIASNPTFGLDFVACEETCRRIMEARNGGAAVLLISEDLDELLGLVDRILVMSGGRIVHEVAADGADKRVIGKYMAGMKAA